MTTCTNCHQPLTPVFPDSNTKMQFANSLVLELHGGYGMYFDHLEPMWGVPPLPFVQFCSDCADKLMEAFPSIAAIIAADR